MNRRIFTICTLLLFVLLLAACGENEPVETAVPTTAALATASATPALPTPTPTTAPTPTPVVPAITVNDQPLAADGRLTIAAVVLPQPGWLALRAVQNGAAADVLATILLPAGVSQNVPLTVEPLAATETLVAALHVDAGETGVFEFPGPDEPLEQDGAPVTSEFVVELQVERPSVTAVDQSVGRDGVVRVEQVTSPARGWVLIHADENGALGTVLGAALVDAGRTNDVAIGIPWREAPARLHAVLYQDLGRPGRLDEAEDLPVLAGGEMVIASFAVSLPPDVFVLDQPVVDGRITLERAVVDRPAWAAVYFDDEDAPGLIIGTARLEEGVNEEVVVNVIETAVTPLLYIILHEDVTPGDAFNFPASDPPLAYDGRLVDPFPFRTNPGNYLIVRDQERPSSGNDALAVTVPLTVVDVNAWVAIHADDNGQRGDVLGVTALPAGISRNVAVEIDADRATETLYAVLYLDAGEAGEFEFPGGPDVPLQRNRAVIQAPFLLAIPDSQTEVNP